MRRLIQVFEYEKLTLHKNAKGDFLEKRELEKLYEFNDNHKNQYFTGIRDGIKFNSYVGVIQIGGLTIEILPKADKVNSSDKDNYDKWRNALLKMLSICRYLKTESVSEANLKKRHHSLLDLYFEIFLDEVSALLRKGLIKKYHTHTANTNALKGRINFSKNIQQNLIHQERFYTTHQVYDYEHTINQILLKGLLVLNTIADNTYLKDRINRILLDFPDIKEIEITKTHFDSLISSRKTVAYQEAIKVAKMIILNYSPDIKNGEENMLTLLFDMNKLWEEYIFRMLQRTSKEGYSVSSQSSEKFWEHKTIRPDIVITKKTTEKEETYIIDTKWKVIDAQNPSDSDLKQMFAYNIYWNAEKSMLLYPQTSETNEKFGKFHKGREGENSCKLGFINIFDSDNLDLEIGSKILDKFEK
jgi:5-methylcytosine-specific restriction enzyme subunit McrC